MKGKEPRSQSCSTMSGGLSNEAEDLEFLGVFHSEMSWMQLKSDQLRSEEMGVSKNRGTPKWMV